MATLQRFQAYQGYWFEVEVHKPSTRLNLFKGSRELSPEAGCPSGTVRGYSRMVFRIRTPEVKCFYRSV